MEAELNASIEALQDAKMVAERELKEAKKSIDSIQKKLEDATLEPKRQP